MDYQSLKRAVVRISRGASSVFQVSKNQSPTKFLDSLSVKRFVRMGQIHY